ncbi:hypothetical protein [Rhodococcus aetherivorans]|uniref:hypothetical protein n=1 Tax=Rhodococcus aetherivorans TaxID=191292 RepID=UPI00045CE70A|nr:hypothetical protein [Rhodococcus aetherivorans]KDE12432.1 hypothetical protein N505_0115400 [Rhodococcus aetherivorans]
MSGVYPIVPTSGELFTIETMHFEGERLVTFQFPSATEGFDLSVEDAHRLIDTLRDAIRHARALN